LLLSSSLAIYTTLKVLKLYKLMLVVTHVTSAHDHAKEQLCILPHQAILRRINKNHLSTNNVYVLQYSNTRAC
jgi:hypothetical protein